MTPPIGLRLSNEYTIGALLGQGAFGQVHVVVRKNGDESQWACKLTAAPVKITKKGSSEAEIAFSRLYAEYLLYSQHFRHLTHILPQLPVTSTDHLPLYFNNLNGTLSWQSMFCASLVAPKSLLNL